MIGRWTRLGRSRVVAALAVAGLTLAGMSAQAGLAVYDQASRAITPSAGPPPTGYEADPHFPGAALLFAVADATPAASAAPAPGTTGTAPLPDLPPPLPAPTGNDASVTAARPFRLAGTPLDHARALQCLTSAIYYEAASEPDAGQRAVAQVVLNRVRHPAFPHTVCGVVFQGSERAGCQFSFACDGAMARMPARAAWARARTAASAALGGSVFAPVGLATHYHTYAVKPAWNRGLVMTGMFGAHFFHRWKGGWGTAPAFSQRYGGGEPVPLPHAPAVPPVVPPVTMAGLPAALTAAPITPAAAQPRTAATPPPLQGEHARSGEVLDRWKDAGTPIR